MQHISAPEAYAALAANPGAVLCDVRTLNEWRMVGVPDLAALGKTPLFLEWIRGPGQPPNPDFLAQLTAHGVEKSTPVYFLCRSGARSTAAAMAAEQAGWTQTFNILAGFEAPGGWRASLLPSTSFRPEE